ncbi:hypothetical protein RNJ44_03893 [Nakaseomyces bracarensis]|uniref:F-box domain-containing protein n=1 Tax=Nakaseomyces bracarensis TaxID=273131 RepID=A0ABR4NY86_9SACH
MEKKGLGLLDTLPAEVLDLILDRLGSEADSSLVLDCFGILNAVPVHNRIYEQIRSRFHLESYVSEERQRDTGVLRLLSSGVQDNEKELSNHENIIWAVDLETWDRQQFQVDLTMLRDKCSKDHKGRLNLLFQVYEGVTFDTEKFHEVLKDILFEIGTVYNIESIIFDAEGSKLVCDKSFFGVLDFEFLELIEKSNTSDFKVNKILIPLVTEMHMNYMTLDSFFYYLLTRFKGYQRDKSILLKNFLSNFKFFLPNLVDLHFVNHQMDSTLVESCNFIDLSSLVLRKCRDNKIKIEQMFKLHSMANWKLPKIKTFTGHRFKFDEIAATGSPERLVVSLRENLKMLHDCAMNDTQDGVSYFRVNLIPEGVIKSKIVNWVPTEISSNVFSKVEHYTTPIICVKCSTLEELELKLLRFEKSSTIEIQGLYLPKLKTLTLSNKPRITNKPVISYRNDSFSLESEKKPLCGYTANLEVTRRRMLTTSNRYNKAHNTSFDNVTFAENPSQITDMNPIAFTSWNELPNCERLAFRSEDSTNYIFNIQNLQEFLPKLDLAGSFPTFVSEKQKFIVV